MIINIESVQEFNKMIDTDVALVKFGASWCVPCKTLDKTLVELSEDSEETVILKVDVDQFPELAGDFGVMSIPTTFAVSNKRQELFSNVSVGVTSMEKLKDMLAKA